MFSFIWSWRHTFFFIKLIKHTSITKYIDLKKNSIKNFSWISTLRFKIEKKLWAHVQFDVYFWFLLLSPYLIEKRVSNEIKVSFSKHYDILVYTWIFCKLEIIENRFIQGILLKYCKHPSKKKMNSWRYTCTLFYMKVSGNSVKNFKDIHPYLK